MPKSGRLAVTRTTVIVLVSLLIIGVGVGLGSLYTIDSISTGGNTSNTNFTSVSTTTSTANQALAVSCTPSPALVGTPATCTATLKSYSKSASGTITWKSASGTFSAKGVCTLSLGSCAVTFTGTSTGTAAINTTFSGNKDNPSSSIIFSLNLDPYLSSVSLSCSIITSIGQTSRCTATVSGFGTPTGNVSFSASGTGIFSGTSCKLKSGTCYVSYTPTSVSAAQNMTADYSGDTNNSPSMSNPVLLGVGVQSSTVQITCSPTTISIGSNSTCQIKVSGYHPTGNITLTSSDRGATFSPLSCAVSSSPCEVKYIPSVIGSANVTAYYSGDSNNTAGSGNATITVGMVTPIVSVSCSPNSVIVGGQTTCKASVQGYSPTGSVSWSSSSVGSFSPSTSCVLTSGSCSVSYTVLSSASPVTIQANYGGDSHNNPKSGTFTLTVSTSSSSTTVTCTPNPVMIDSTANCNASVMGYMPSGTVSFSSTDTGSMFTPSSCSLVTSGGTGSCSVTYTPSAAGQAKITGQYSGDPNNAAASGSFELTVNLVLTSTTISCSPVTIGGTSSCNISVTGDNPSGSVPLSSSDSGAAFTPCILSGGSCSVTYTPSVAGSATITANYPGDSLNAPSSGNTNLDVTRFTSSLSVSCIPNSVPSNGTITCTATVTGYASLSGTVTWQTTNGNGTFSSSSCTLSSGSCLVTYTATNDVSGSTVTILANYSGDQNDLQSSGFALISIL